MEREPVVAGQFYPRNRQLLQQELRELVKLSTERRKVLGIIAPHAGYLYSGKIAGAVYGEIDVPKTVLVLGPNHHDRGARVALFPSGSWCTPLGSVPINEQLSKLILKQASSVTVDAEAHQFEHSLEVQIPFLQYLQPEVTIVPLCLGFADYASCETLGKAVAEAVKEYGDEVLIVASSDMTHYEPATEAHCKDSQAINEILALNPSGLFTVVRNNAISMCGVIPAVVMLVASRELGATSSALIQYATSGDVSGDYTQVVGYAAVTVS